MFAENGWPVGIARRGKPVFARARSGIDGGEGGQGGGRVSTAAGRHGLEVAAVVRVGEGRRVSGSRGPAQHTVLGEQRRESRTRKGGDVAAELGGSVDAREQRRLSGGALRQTGHPERGVEGAEVPAVAAPDPLGGQAAAEQCAQGRQRLGGERVGGGLGG